MSDVHVGRCRHCELYHRKLMRFGRFGAAAVTIAAAVILVAIWTQDERWAHTAWLAGSLALLSLPAGLLLVGETPHCRDSDCIQSRRYL